MSNHFFQPKLDAVRLKAGLNDIFIHPDGIPSLPTVGGFNQNASLGSRTE